MRNISPKILLFSPFFFDNYLIFVKRQKIVQFLEQLKNINNENSQLESQIAEMIPEFEEAQEILQKEINLVQEISNKFKIISPQLSQQNEIEEKKQEIEEKPENQLEKNEKMKEIEEKQEFFLEKNEEIQKKDEEKEENEEIISPSSQKPPQPLAFPEIPDTTIISSPPSQTSQELFHEDVENKNRRTRKTKKKQEKKGKNLDIFQETQTKPQPHE